ncbi:TPA: TIGR03749 family integrating conjugative element protein [Salmonella enterica subsp. enterica serovar Muenchen]|nr:TIGR03749 family integrating conjugative element protein [Salmonella enterica subsp. enterica serovar Chester]HEC7513845.1 TIGR03749 family integrating conjugative element protein [Salmonella enterica subsp. enterica serovar Muenchen]EHZ1826459.1 TIGR03749 family integrating conjugative element protein [Salmonella enterica subsp. enterica serovar Chester]HEC7519803.1 TIGR03749 family integrating conjugative element protein [Salmonella enterica subsp. enterica serovar Muenchen]HEC7579274.1 TI
MRYCRGLSVLLFLLGALCSPFSHAVELMKWERIPLQVPLTVGQERIVFVDKNVKVGFPVSLDGKLRIQSSGGTVYLDASAAFPVTRLVLKDVESGEIVLMDVSAAEGKTVREPVQIVYHGTVESATRSEPAEGDNGSSGTEAWRTGNRHKAATPASRQAPKLNGPLPVVMTRYAAQTLYAPLRTVEALPGIHPLPLRLPSHITTLYPSEPVDIRPLAAWGRGEYSVVALMVRNTGSGKVVTDPRALIGRFVAATFQHRWLGAAGQPEDTTTLYLVMQGRPEPAFIAEPPTIVKKEGKR